MRSCPSSRPSNSWLSCLSRCYRSRGETMTKRSSLAAIGEPVVRKEDAELVTGQGRFSDDVNLPGQAYAVMVRSPHAHARIRGIDVSAAMAVPGVIAVLTGADAIEDGLKPIPHRPILGPPDIALGKRDASDKFLSSHRVLPTDKARFAGEAVAMVVADSLGAAKDAAERVTVDFEPLPAVSEAINAIAPDAPLVWDEARSNVCVDAEVGDAAATARAFERATHIVKLQTGCSASPACRSSRAPPSAATIGRPAAPRFTPAAAASFDRSTNSPAFSTSRRIAFASSPATSAATSAPPTRSIPNSRWWRGGRGPPGGPSNGHAND